MKHYKVQHHEGSPVSICARLPHSVTIDVHLPPILQLADGLGKALIDAPAGFDAITGLVMTTSY